MKHRLIALLLNPYIIALYISLAVIICLPNYFSKYKVETQSEMSLNFEQNKIFYNDFDGDGKSELIKLQTNTLGNASFLSYKSNGDFVDQINLNSKWPYRPNANTRNLRFCDVNEDGEKEVYLITQRADSAFLNIIEPFNNKGIRRSGIFIDTISSFNGEYRFWEAYTNDFFKSKIKRGDIILGINTGFAANPRNIYKYNFESNTIVKSPHLTNTFSISDLGDLDGENKSYILTNTVAYANSIDSIYSMRSDASTWLNILDDDLNFLFEPIEFNAIGSLHNYAIKENEKTKLITLFKSRQLEKLPSKLLKLNINGSLEKELNIPIIGEAELFLMGNNRFVVTDKDFGIAKIYNKNFQLVRECKIEPFVQMIHCDIDNDGQKEWITLDKGYDRVFIYRKNFEDMVTFSLKGASLGKVDFGFRDLGNSLRQLYVHKGRFLTFCTYQKNPLYVYQYGIYAAIYLGVLGLVFLVLKGQSIREAKKRAIEDEISELQIKTIKNQVDPHFVFNAINTISEMTLADNKLEADNFICRFSDFMRQTLQASDKITATLKQELEYTENFIKLQKIRYNNSFGYTIEVDSTINTETKIPKHVLFTYVENAIKHGLALNPIKGLLKIEVKKTEKGLFLAIEDNGAGMRTTNNKVHSTGSGLLIMEKIFDLYGKLNNKRITHKLIDLNEVSGQSNGSRVEILIAKTV